MNLPEFRIYDISGIDLESFEAMGTKSKFWFEDEDNRIKLFKATVALDKNGNEIQRHGEDWAEKIVCEVANSLSIPCANYELAVRDGQPGVISENFVQPSQKMIHGNEVIAHIMRWSGDRPAVSQNKGHRIGRVYRAVQYIAMNKPAGWNSLPGIKTALDFFCGYVMLDTLVSNQDRHDENWGVIQSSDGTRHLAPTYDHAASLGRNESDENRKRRLEAKDKGLKVETYVRKAKSQFLDLNEKRIKNLDAFSYFSNINPSATNAWLERLNNITPSNFEDIIRRIPEERMSSTTKEFTYEILCENRKNLLETRAN